MYIQLTRIILKNKNTNFICIYKNIFLILHVLRIVHRLTFYRHEDIRFLYFLETIKKSKLLNL